VAGLELVVTELVRSADAFAGVVVVNAHGGNAEPLARAAATLISEGRRVLAWSPRPSGDTDAHAGRTETSLMLALAPDDVHVEVAEAGARRPLAELGPRLRSGGVRSVSANGVLGDPSGATADEGWRLLEAMTVDLVSAVDRWTA
jgi:mycofactocin precursor peptide peptidase